MWVGVDNGLSGGLCAIDQQGRPYRYARMPVKEFRGRNVMDLAEVVVWLQRLETRVRLVVEEAPHHGDSASAIRSLGIGYGKLLALEDILRYDITVVAPKTWQAQMLPKGRGNTKARALAAAKQLAPEEDWIPPRCRTPHDGVVDAYLMACWAQKNN